MFDYRTKEEKQLEQRINKAILDNVSLEKLCRDMSRNGCLANVSDNYLDHLIEQVSRRETTISDLYVALHDSRERRQRSAA